MAIYKRGSQWHLDVTINGVRYREALDTTDHREASRLEKTRVGEIQQGKGASLLGRDFARKQFGQAADQFLEDRKPHVAERTHQLEKYLLTALREFFGTTSLLRIKAADIAAYQRRRREKGIAGRTLNMEIAVLRLMMRRAKVWAVVAEDVQMDRENTNPVAKVLTADQKRTLFETAASKEEWMVAFCAAVLAVNTTCRGVELKHLRWSDVDLFEKHITIRRSKTQAGLRVIPLNNDAAAALGRLLRRGEILGASDPGSFVFPACENGEIDPTRPQKTWRTAWRSLVKAAANRAAGEAARAALRTSRSLSSAKTAWRRTAAAFKDLRFHDLRHQAITELAEAGATDATLMALAGHMSREMLEHYSHVRMAAKRSAVESLGTGLMKPKADEPSVSNA